MIKIEVSDDTWKEIEKRHKDYVKSTIIPVWKVIIGKTVCKKKVTYEEVRIIVKSLRRHSVKINQAADIFISAQLENYAITNEELFPDQEIQTYQSLYPKMKIMEIRKRLVDILLYGLGYKEKFSNKKVSKKNSWGRHKFLNCLDVKTCPYCNRQYITSYTLADNSRWATADVDHYYPKERFPLLSMNVHNMIPSCAVCNSRMKGQRVKEKKDAHLYPYVDDSDTLFFQCINDSDIKYLVGTAPVELELSVNALLTKEQQKRAEQSLEVFRLKEVYQSHKNVVEELLINIQNCTQWEYDNIIKKNYPGVFQNFDELRNMVFDFLGKQEGSEPLIKLKKDIYRQEE